MKNAQREFLYKKTQSGNICGGLSGSVIKRKVCVHPNTTATIKWPLAFTEEWCCVFCVPLTLAQGRGDWGQYPRLQKLQLSPSRFHLLSPFPSGVVQSISPTSKKVGTRTRQAPLSSLVLVLPVSNRKPPQQSLLLAGLPGLC